VVERWIMRELSPAAQVRDLVDQGRRTLDGLTRWAEAQPQSPPPPVVVKKASATSTAALIVAALALAVAGTALGVILSLVLL
jgi:hypothetical protein